MLRLCVRQMRIQIPPRMQFSAHKKGWMDEEGIFLLLFIFGKSFDRTVVQRGDCQNCDIICTILTDTVIFRIDDCLYHAPRFWNRSRLFKQNFFQKCCRKWNSDLDWLKGTKLSRKRLKIQPNPFSDIASKYTKDNNLVCLQVK